jgi:cellobiose phosphorylase
MLNPVTHASAGAASERYRVEPYIIAADVYSEPPHAGRGGWTWYTGAAGWMYRAGLEAILGLRRQGASLWLKPNLPSAWDHAEISVRLEGVQHIISVRRGAKNACRHPVMPEGEFVFAPKPGAKGTRIEAEIPA